MRNEYFVCIIYQPKDEPDKKSEKVQSSTYFYLSYKDLVRDFDAIFGRGNWGEDEKSKELNDEVLKTGWAKKQIKYFTTIDYKWIFTRTGIEIK